VAAGAVILFHVPLLDQFGLSPSTVGLSDFLSEGAGELVGDSHLWLLGATKGEEEGVANTVGAFYGWMLGFLVGTSKGEFKQCHSDRRLDRHQKATLLDGQALASDAPVC
jgi:hypothetical protein